MGTGQSKEEQLYQAAQLGNHQLVKSLRRDGASLEWIDKEGRTPLILACTRAELFEMVMTLLNLGANINAYRPGAHGGFPLHHAAKRGLDKTVVLLLMRGADPLAINDDGQTPLDMARLRGHLSIVHIIEERICLFRGVLRELSGPTFLEALAPHWVTKKVWAVVLPAESSIRRRPPRYELVIYQSFTVPQPRTVISLAKADVAEPKYNLSDPALIIIERSTKSRYKFLSENEGDKRQLERLYKACRGIPQFDGVAPEEPVSQASPALEAQPPDPSNAGQGAEVIPEDVALAMAINASLQSASSGVAFPPAAQGSSKDNDDKGWANVPEGSCNGWGPPDLKNPEVKSNFDGWGDDGESTYNGWGSSEAGPSVVHVITETHSIVSGDVSTAAASAPSPQAELPCTVVSGSQGVSALNNTPPSAPPLPSEYAPFVTDDSSPIQYPSIDTSPLELNYRPADLSKQSPAIKENADEKAAASVCVVCWDSPAEAVCIPCGHLAGCMGCISEIKAKQWGCPVCRTSIDQVVKVYTV